MPLISMRAPREDKIFYASLIRLTEKAHRHASSRLEDLQKKLLGMLIEKEAQITNVASHVVPIPLDVDPLEMWGLSES